MKRIARQAAWAAMTSGLAVAAYAGAAQADPMGREPYRFPARDPSMAAQYQLLQRGGAGAALAGGSVMYNSSTTTIGNLNEISQILAEGAEAYLNHNTSQENHGNQSSNTDSSILVDNTKGDDDADNGAEDDVDG